jgi:hypothetical protein
MGATKTSLQIAAKLQQVPQRVHGQAIGAIIDLAKGYRMEVPDINTHRTVQNAAT